jgi:hypothetical protein
LDVGLFWKVLAFSHRTQVLLQIWLSLYFKP